MPLMPKRTKHRKMQKGRMRGKATRGNRVTDGEYGVQAVTGALVTGNQIEAARVAMTRYIKRGGKVWIKVFPDKPLTSKPIGTRMGKGKGAPESWVAVVKPGRVMFEIAGVSEDIAREALRLAMNKLPNKTKFVTRETEKVGENMRLFVRNGKGERERYTVLPKTSLEMLRICYKMYQPNHPEGYMFLNREGNPLKVERLRVFFRRYRRKAGISEDFIVHSLRHAFSTRLVEEGIPLVQIKELLGHSCIRSTMTYVHVASNMQKVDSPLDIFLKKKEEK